MADNPLNCGPELALTHTHNHFLSNFLLTTDKHCHWIKLWDWTGFSPYLRPLFVHFSSPPTDKHCCWIRQVEDGRYGQSLYTIQEKEIKIAKNVGKFCFHSYSVLFLFVFEYSEYSYSYSDKSGTLNNICIRIQPNFWTQVVQCICIFIRFQKHYSLTSGLLLMLICAVHRHWQGFCFCNSYRPRGRFWSGACDLQQFIIFLWAEWKIRNRLIFIEFHSRWQNDDGNDSTNSTCTWNTWLCCRPSVSLVMVVLWQLVGILDLLWKSTSDVSSSMQENQFYITRRIKDTLS